MSQGEVLTVARETIWVILKTALPLLLVSLIVGLIVSLFQTLTSIQEQTLTFVPKLLAIFLSLMLLGSWMANTIGTFVETLWSNFATYIR
jgi:flagellar biosynthetic protein FliQ